MSFDATKSRRAAIAARNDIARIAMWMVDKTHNDLRDDTLLRYAVERAFMCIDAAIRDIPADLTYKHALPMRFIAGFRNRLAHSYEDIVDERIIDTIRDDLPLLDAQLIGIISDLEAEA